MADKPKPSNPSPRRMEAPPPKGKRGGFEAGHRGSAGSIINVRPSEFTPGSSRKESSSSGNSGDKKS
jgi:hypothetical protein